MSVGDLMQEALRQGLQSHVTHLFDVLARAGEREAEIRFRNGIVRSLEAYERASEIIVECTKDK